MATSKSRCPRGTVRHLPPANIRRGKAPDCFVHQRSARLTAHTGGVPDPDVSATVLGRVIVQAGRQLDVPFGNVLQRHRLTRNAWWLLTELYRTRHDEAVTVGEHARRAGLASSSATVVTEQLTQRGLTRRWRPPDNRRITYVTITETGLATVEAVRADIEQAIGDLYQLYDSDQRRTLHALLARMVDIDKHHAPGPGTEPTGPARGRGARR